MPIDVMAVFCQALFDDQADLSGKVWLVWVAWWWGHMENTTWSQCPRFDFRRILVIQSIYLSIKAEAAFQSHKVFSSPANLTPQFRSHSPVVGEQKMKEYYEVNCDVGKFIKTKRQ